jgi:hypothetical protein
MEKIAINPDIYANLKAVLERMVGPTPIPDAQAALPYGLGATAVGTAGGALHQHTEEHPDKELNKIKDALKLQELQSPTGNLEDLKKLSDEQNLYKLAMTYKTAAPISGVTTAALGGLGLAALSIPGYLTYDWMKQRYKAKQVDQEVQKINDLKKKYDDSFKQDMMNELKVDPNAMESMVQNMGKTSSAVDTYTRLALGTGGAGVGMMAFMKGRDEAEANTPRIQKIKMYRRAIEGLTKARPNAALAKLPMSLEEQVAMEATRDTVGEKGADEVKNTKGGTDAPRLSAKVNDPDLQKLLQSV